MVQDTSAKVRKKIGTAKYFADIIPFVRSMMPEIFWKQKKHPQKKWPARQRNHLVIKRISVGHFFVRGHFQLSVITGYGV